MRIVAKGIWTYGGTATMPVDIIALDFDWWHELARADGDAARELAEPLGPDGVLYYVRFGRAGHTDEPTWVDSSGYQYLSDARNFAATRVPTPIVWAPEAQHT